MIADFRSDTVTQPGPQMRSLMASAVVGDDVFGEDPSINGLETFAAEMFGMEAALFCPSGTMTNQIAIKVHTQPGDEVICDQDSHVYQYEGGGIAFHSGCSVKLLAGDRGRIHAAQVLGAIQPDDVHRPVSRLVSIENTSNRGGGSCYNLQDLNEIRQVCREKGLRLHLDGARLFNALVANNETPVAHGQLFDSISICLSKGLGAPVGSLLLGAGDFIKKARRIRKLMGGGMRQGGFLAAAGHWALQNGVARLKTDHEHARELAGVLEKTRFVDSLLPVETNIIIANIRQPITAAEVRDKLQAQGVLVYAIATDRIRMVTHLDLPPDKIQFTVEQIIKLDKEYVSRLTPRPDGSLAKTEASL